MNQTLAGENGWYKMPARLPVDEDAALAIIARDAFFERTPRRRCRETATGKFLCDLNGIANSSPCLTLNPLSSSFHERTVD